MKDTRLFKVRRKVDGLFATRNHGYGGTHWGKLGTIWRGVGPLKMAFRSSLKHIDWGLCELVLFELKEVAVLKPFDIVKPTKK